MHVAIGPPNYIFALLDSRYTLWLADLTSFELVTFPLSLRSSPTELRRLMLETGSIASSVDPIITTSSYYHLYHYYYIYCEFFNAAASIIATIGEM